MAASFDNLIEFLLEQIALCGDQGASVCEFEKFVRGFYSKLGNAGDEKESAPHEQASVPVDASLLEYVWKWFTSHPEVFVGPNKEGNNLSFADAQSCHVPRPTVETPEQHGRSNQTQRTQRAPRDRDLPPETSGCVAAAEGEEPSPPDLVRLQINTPDEISRVPPQPASNSQQSSGQALSQANGEKSQRAASASKKADLRIYTTQDRIWQAITGHGVDPKKVVPLEFELLCIIAAQGEKGILQSDLTKLSGQDKRSVPKRTDNLREKGYIAKRAILAVGHQTSICTLKRFVQHGDESGPVFEKGILSPGPFLEKLVSLLNDSTANAMTMDDVRLCMGGYGKKQMRRQINRLLEMLEDLGIIKRIIAPVRGIKSANKKRRCIKLVREPDERDRGLFSGYHEKGPWAHKLRAAIKAKSKANDGLQKDIPSEEDASDDDDLELGLAGNGNVDDDALDENDAFSSPSRIVPQWTPDQPFYNFIFNIVESAGPEGLKSMDLQARTAGCFWKRPFYQMMSRLTDAWRVSQPLHLRHLAIIRDTVIFEKANTYKFRSFQNFQKAVDAGMTAWEALGFSEGQRPEAPSRIVEATEALAQGDLDEWGFPHLDPEDFVDEIGTATLLECYQSGKIRDRSQEDAKVAKAKKGKAKAAAGGTPRLSRVPEGPKLPGTGKGAKKVYPKGLEPWKHPDPEIKRAYWAKYRNGGKKTARTRKAKGTKRKAVELDEPAAVAARTPELADAGNAQEGGQGVPGQETSRKKSRPGKRRKVDVPPAPPTPTREPGIYINPPGVTKPRKGRGRQKKALLLVWRSDRLSELDWFKETLSDRAGTVPWTAVNGSENSPPPAAEIPGAEISETPGTAKVPGIQSEATHTETPGPRSLKMVEVPRTGSPETCTISTARSATVDATTTPRNNALEDLGARTSITPADPKVPEEYVAGRVENAVQLATIASRTVAPTPPSTEPSELGQAEEAREVLPTRSSDEEFANLISRHPLRDPFRSKSSVALTKPKKTRKRAANRVSRAAEFAAMIPGTAATVALPIENLVPGQLNTTREDTMGSSVENPTRSPARQPADEALTRVSAPLVCRVIGNQSSEAGCSLDQPTNREPVPTENSTASGTSPTSSLVATPSQTNLESHRNHRLATTPHVLAPPIVEKVNWFSQSLQAQTSTYRSPYITNSKHNPLPSQQQGLSHKSAMLELVAHKNLRQGENLPTNEDLRPVQSTEGGKPASAEDSQNGNLSISDLNASGTTPSQETPRVSRKGHTKAGVPLGGGNVHWSRTKILVEIVTQHGGIYPGDGAIYIPFAREWVKQFKSTKPDRATCHRAVKRVVEAGKLTQIMFSFQSGAGMPVVRSVITLPGFPSNSLQVKDMQGKIIKAHPFPYIPGEGELFTSNDRVRWGAQRNNSDFEIDDDLTVELHVKPKYMLRLEEKLKQAVEHQRRKIAEKSAKRTTRKRLDGSKLDSSRLQRLQRLPQDPRAQGRGQNAMFSLDSGFDIDTTFWDSEDEPVIPTADEGDFLVWDGRVPGAQRTLYESPYTPVEPPTVLRGLLFRDEIHRGPIRRRRGGATRKGAAFRVDKQPAWEMSRQQQPRSRRPHGKRVRFEDESDENGRSPKRHKWVVFGPETYDPKYEAQVITSLTHPLQRFHSLSGTFSTDFAAECNARLELWLDSRGTPDHCLAARKRKIPEKARKDDILPQSLEDILSSDVRVKPRPHRTWTDPDYCKFDWDIEYVKRWEMERQNIPIKSICPGFINHTLAPNTIVSARENLGSAQPGEIGPSPVPTVVGGADEWRVYTLSAPPPTSAGDLDSEEEQTPKQKKARTARPTRNAVPLAASEAVPAGEEKDGNSECAESSEDELEASIASSIKPQDSVLDAYLAEARRIARRRLKTRGSAIEKPVSISPADTKRLLFAIVVTRVLLGGLDQGINWAIVARAFRKRFPIFPRKDFTTRWIWLKSNYSTVVEKLQEQFQDAYLQAYERDEIPPIDYDDVDGYDWARIARWAEENVAMPNDEQPKLPPDRASFEEAFSMEELPTSHGPSRVDIYNPSITILHRHNLALQYPHWNLLEKHPQTQDLQPADPQPELASERAKSWIRANVMTPTGEYNQTLACQKLVRLGEETLRKSVSELQHAKIVKTVSQGRRNNTNRSYALTDNFWKAIDRQLEPRHFHEAAQCKRHFDAKFASHPLSGSDDPHGPFVTIPQDAHDGAIMAVSNLLAHGRVTLVPKLPAIDNEFGKPFPRISKWGLAEGDYKTKFLDKSKIFFDLAVVPTKDYVFGNPLNTVAEGEAGDEELSSMAGSWQRNLPPPPLISPSETAPLPLWVDIHGHLHWDWWQRIVAGVVQTIATRAGITFDGLRFALGGKLWKWEMEHLLEWLKDVGAIMQDKSGGLRTREWWWLVIPEQPNGKVGVAGPRDTGRDKEAVSEKENWRGTGRDKGKEKAVMRGGLTVPPNQYDDAGPSTQGTEPEPIVLD